MNNPESITVNEDARLIPVWSIVVSIAAFTLVEYYFWMVVAAAAASSGPAYRAAHLLQSLLGLAGSHLFLDGRLCQQRRSAPGHELAVLDGAVFRDAGRHRGRALFPVARTGGFALPGLRNACSKRLPFLSAVRLSTFSQLR